MTNKRNNDKHDKYHRCSSRPLQDDIAKVIFFGLDGGTLRRHIVKVARALAKVASNVHDLDSIMDYLQVLGKLHHQHGMQVIFLSKNKRLGTT